MNFRRIFNKRIRHDGEGAQVAADLNAVVVGNVGKKGSSSGVSSRQQTRVVQRSGKTVVSDSRHDSEGGGT